MLVSTNYPRTENQINAYLQKRGDGRLPTNASAEQDQSYLAEKKIRLVEKMKGWPVGTCSRCSGVIHNAPYLSRTEAGEFCSRRCHLHLPRAIWNPHEHLKLLPSQLEASERSQH